MKVVDVKQNWTSFIKVVRRRFSLRGDEGLDPGRLKALARGIATTRPDEIDCAACFEQVDGFVDLRLAGKDAAEALPLVEDHLARCGDCREEFEALLLALRAAA